MPLVYQLTTSTNGTVGIDAIYSVDKDPPAPPQGRTSPQPISSYFATTEESSSPEDLKRQINAAREHYSKLYRAIHVSPESSVDGTTFAMAVQNMEVLADAVKNLETILFKTIRAEAKTEEDKKKAKDKVKGLRGCIVALMQGFVLRMLEKHAPVLSPSEKGFLSVTPSQRAHEYHKLLTQLKEEYDSEYIFQMMKSLRAYVLVSMDGESISASVLDHPNAKRIMRTFCEELQRARYAYLAQTWLPELVMKPSQEVHAMLLFPWLIFLDP